ncbi:MAG TPA: DUF2726 domain-containing protein [Phycisphaerales bacterium]|nr:DUF2726 domain-containing protein [Phycisphaerales bacterium]
MIYALWGLTAVCAILAVAAGAWLLRARGQQRRAVEERRKRYALKETSERIPIATERAAPVLAPPIEEIAPPVRVPASGPPTFPEREGEPPRHTPVTGRMVNTPDGEMILTTPPFTLRESIFGHSVGRFVNALYRRVPAWVILCPRVRMDTLVVPTPPDGRDPHDWRDWRKRVRLRSLDLVLCDRRTWRPLVAVMFDNRPTNARALGGGRDRMTDEVLAQVGLPLLHLTGDFAADWPMIQPYVEQSILRHVSDEEAMEATMLRESPVDADSAATLLRLDSEKGWLLE